MKNYFIPHITEKDFERITGKHCNGIAYQVDIDTYSNNDLGNLARECTIFILGKLAENMKDGETLSEYFKRKGKEDNIQ